MAKTGRAHPDLLAFGFVSRAKITKGAMNSIQKVVDAVLRARLRKASDSEIHEQLSQLGIPASDAESVIESVEQGFKAGTVAVVIRGTPANITFGENPIFDAAYRCGKAAMRFTTPGWMLIWMAAPWLLLAILIAVVVYFVAK